VVLAGGTRSGVAKGGFSVGAVPRYEPDSIDRPVSDASSKTGWVTPAAVGLSIVVGLLLVGLACSSDGGDGDATARDAVLTLDDLPAGYVSREAELEIGEGTASRFGVDFWLDRSPEAGEIVCITDGATVHRSEGDAQRGLQDTVGRLRESGFKDLPVPKIGDETEVLLLAPTKPITCGEFVRIDAHIAYVSFRQGRVTATLIVWSFEREVSVDEALTLAERQLERIRRTFD
jgi:hypothetical protein